MVAGCEPIRRWWSGGGFVALLWYGRLGSGLCRVMRDVESPITTVGSFEVFFNEAEPRLHDALSACLGGELSYNRMLWMTGPGEKGGVPFQT